MKCRQCAAEIAEKAIVCYRCGTPTADLPSPDLRSTVGRSGRNRTLVWIIVVVVAAIVAAVLYFLVAAPPAV